MLTIEEILKSNNIQYETKKDIAYLVHKGETDLEVLNNIVKDRAASHEILLRKKNPDMNVLAMGYYGNIWIRMQYYQKKDIPHIGHKHKHDHMSLLVKGGLEVRIEGKKPFEVWAAGNAEMPTFFEVAADHMHELIPLEDETVAYCLFALRDENGELTNDAEQGDYKQYGILS